MPLPQNHLAVSAPVHLEAYPGLGKFSWSSELRHLTSNKFLNILWWPVFKYNQRWFLRSEAFQSCRKLPGFMDLWNTIQKGAFAYNTLFFGMAPFRRSATDLADITTLALFFGDEFIDGIAETAGKTFIKQLVENDAEIFYLQTKTNGKTIILKYCFDLSSLLPVEVLRQVNPSYKISYKRFYELLESFLKLINEYLSKMPFEKAERAASKITDACNTCFDSFLHDVSSCTVPGNLRDVTTVLHFHESKTAYMQRKLLELRCVLVNQEEAMNSTQAPGWFDLMRVIQIYDDIHDPVIDDGFQDNLLLSVAYHHFPDEWDWFCLNRCVLKHTKDKPQLFSLYMPCSMEYCFRLASQKIMAMNWEQQKIMHYLIFKNKYCLYKDKSDVNFGNKGDFLLQFYRKIKNRMSHLPEAVIKSYVINTCIHLRKTRNQLFNKLNFTKAYQLRYNLFSLSEEEKVTIFDSATAK